MCSKVACLALGAAGLLLSLYALVVKSEMSMKNEGYIPLCDITESMSCSKAVFASHAKGFGLVGPLLGEEHPANLSNSIFTVAFYSAMILFSLFNCRALASLQTLLALGALALSCRSALLLLPVSCPLGLSLLATDLLLLLACWARRCGLPGGRHTDGRVSAMMRQDGYLNNNRDGFKKFI
jgi:vitamin-K-epoxide reductase (warfarin-sensitive)